MGSAEKAVKTFICWSASTDLTDLIWPESLTIVLGLKEDYQHRGLEALAEILPADCLNNVISVITTTAATGVPSRIRTKTLDEIDITHLEFHTWVQRFDGLKEAKLMGIIIDVSEDEWRRDELLRSKELLIDAQLMANLFYWQYDVQTGEIYWSDGIYDMFGLDRDIELSKNFFDQYIHPADYLSFVEMRSRVAREGMPKGYDFRAIIHGQVHYLRMFAVAFRDEGGEVYKLMGITQDITELKKAQETLEDLNRDLEARVEERTKELRAAQVELRKSEKLATLGQLTATVSHELRNPLSTIFTSIDILKNYADSNELSVESINRIERAANRCDSIIDELLDYTRLSIRSLEPVQLDEYLEEYYLSCDLPEDVTVNREWGAAGSKVMIDSDLFRRVLINLVENACQWMEIQDGKKRLDLISRSEDNQCVIEIIDNGPGIAEKDQKKIFEPLFSTRTFGVGLGLTIVQQIMHQLGGRIEIRSKLGKGTHVLLRLPKRKEDTD